MFTEGIIPGMRGERENRLKGWKGGKIACTEN
jgi:hypothetical protein